MRVDTLRATPNPERLACRVARGDYSTEWVGSDRPFDDIMEPVDGESVEEKMETLLEHLMRSGHWGPWEHPQITFAVEGVSRSCMAQLTRHRLVSFDVQSMRYANFSEKDDPIQVPASITRDEHVARETGIVELDGIDPEWVEESYREKADDLVDWYERMVDHGMPKEDARFLLPLGTKVNLTMSMNARTFLHIEDMRGKGGGDAQWEIQELTGKLRDEFEEWMPITAQLYDRFGPYKLSP